MKRSHVVVPLLLALAIASVKAAPVTRERVAELPEGERGAWTKYIEQSKALAAADQAALEAELKAAGLAAPIKTPDGGDFKLPKTGDAYFGGEEAGKLADVILSYQTASGGWSKHTGYAKGPRQPGMLWSSQYLPGEKPHYLATYDNGSTTSQLHFLANVWQAKQREDCKAAVLKGLDFVLASQYPSGGFPQVYPIEGGYHDDITFNDDAMTHVLQLLYAIGSKQPQFGFVDEGRRARVSKALQAGIACVLKAQIEVGGKKTVWCAQHDPVTLQPTRARAMEPAALSGSESVRILEFLMSVQNPPPEVVKAIESGLAWLEGAKITGLRKATEGKTGFEADPASSEVYWARFYDLATGKPIFPGRDGVVYDTFAEMAAKNKLGYDFYTTHPQSLLNTGKKNWLKRLAAEKKAP